MRKPQFVVGGLGLAAFLAAAFVLGQPPTPSETPAPTPMLVSTSTPTPSVSPNETSPLASQTLTVPSALTSPSPSATPIAVQAAALGESDLGWSEKGAPVFRLDQAVIAALTQNPTVLQALDEIRRTKGVIIEIRAQALPQFSPSFSFNWTDPNLRQNNTGFTTFGGTGGGGGGGGKGVGGIKNLRSDITYNVQVTGTQ